MSNKTENSGAGLGQSGDPQISGVFRIYLLSNQLQAAFRVAAWCFSPESQQILFRSTSEYQDELLSFLNISGALNYPYEHSDFRRPIFFTDALGCVWIGEWFIDPYVPQGKPLFFALGPVLYGINTAKNLERQLNSLNYTEEMRENILRVLQTLPIIPPTVFSGFGIMLHCALTNEQISASDCLYQTNWSRGELPPESTPDYLLSYEESFHEAEGFLLRAVKSGDPEGVRKAMEGMASRAYELNINDPLRNMKDTLVIQTALVSRAAIEGGLPPRTAVALEHHYLGAVESVDTYSALAELRLAMMEDYARRVRAVREGSGVSRSIAECQAYINANLLNEITLRSIASHMGYSEYYLTKKFARETGMKMADYIKRQRVDFAKIWLLTTNKSIQEISESLHFGNRSVFSTVFQSLTGKSPARYREEFTKEGENGQ